MRFCPLVKLWQNSGDVTSEMLTWHITRIYDRMLPKRNPGEGDVLVGVNFAKPKVWRVYERKKRENEQIRWSRKNEGIKQSSWILTLTVRQLGNTFLCWGASSSGATLYLFSLFHINQIICYTIFTLLPLLYQCASDILQIYIHVTFFFLFFKRFTFPKLN